MKQADVAIHADRMIEQQQALTRFPESARQAPRDGGVDVGKAPVCEIRSCCDADERLDPLWAEERQMKSDPAAHRRTDEDHGTVDKPIERRKRFFEPGRESPILEPAAARSGARIVES